MATDPSISLAVRPPVIAPLQIRSPLDQFARLQSLRNLMQQGQSGQLSLQEQQLKLDQERRDVAERQRIADYFASLSGGGDTGATPAQAAPAPLQPPQTAPTMVGPDQAAAVAPGAPLGALMARPPAAAPTVGPAPTVAALAGGPPRAFNAGDLIRIAPNLGPGIAKAQFGIQQADAEARIKQHDADMGRADELGRLARAVKESNDPPAQFKTALMDAAGRGLLAPAVARQMIEEGYDAHKNDIDTFIARAQNGKDSSEIAKNALAAALDKRKMAREDYSQVANQDAHANFIARYPELQPVLGDTFSPDVKDAFQFSDTAAKDLPKAHMDAVTAAASVLAPARAKGGPAFSAALAEQPKYIRDHYASAGTAADVMRLALTPEQTTTADQAAATAAETAKQHAATNANERARIGLQQQEQAIRQKTFDATYGALVDPNTGKPMDGDTAKAVAMADPVAVAIANYQGAPPSLSRGGQAASIMRKVMAINPDYNAQNWQTQGAMLKNATSGKMGNELRASNTALGHVGILYDAIDGLNNGDLRVLNRIGNSLGIETGKTPAAVFQLIVGKVGPELAQAYGEATGGERKVEKGNFDPNLPPQTLKANAAMTAKLLAGKLAATKFQFQSTPGFEKRALPMVSPEAQSVLDRLGAGSGPGTGANLPEITTQAAYDALPKGAQYTHNGERLTKK